MGFEDSSKNEGVSLEGIKNVFTHMTTISTKRIKLH